MGVGRYLLNFGVISSIAGSIGVAKQTEKMPQDWRRVLVWGVWAAGVVLAFASVRYAESDKAHIEANKAAKKEEKEQEKKAAKELHKKRQKLG
ncbi:MAG: hypothetical protein Q4C71_03665 [Microbacteriaceae bacterium]|nr:hypothetical protein [Microbacteriaceae bacterium]